MKKNRTMRLAALLLVLTLITSCFVGGTFAKYITSDAAGDSARVAKWGIDVLVSGNLFGQFYNPNTATADKDLIAATAQNSVDNGTTDGKDIVAPGTKNETGFTVQISGTPEVAYKVTANTGAAVSGKSANEDIFLGKGSWGVMVEAKGLNAASNCAGLYTKDGDNYTVVADDEATTDKNEAAYVSGKTYYELHDAVTLTADYYPINWKVEAKDGATAISETKNLTVIAGKMVEGIQETTTVNANTDTKASYTLTWAWPFENGTKNSVTHKAENDVEDTILGNLQAKTAVVYKADASATSYGKPDDGTNYNLDIVFNFEVIVEQVD